MAAHSSILTGEPKWIEEMSRLYSPWGGHNRSRTPWTRWAQPQSVTFTVSGLGKGLKSGEGERRRGLMLRKVILPFKVYSSMVFLNVCNRHYGQTYNIFMTSKKHSGTSLLMQRRWVCFLVQKIPHAAEPSALHRNYWESRVAVTEAPYLEPALHKRSHALCN